MKNRDVSPSVEIGKISSSKVYNGRVISVEVDRVRFPDGSVGDLEMVRHPGASAVVPVLEAGGNPQVLLIKQYRYAANGYVYEIPAGRLDPGESPEDCAMRELREETGYSAKQLHSLTTIYTTPGFTDERIHLFVANGLVAGTAQRERDEFLELYPVLLSEAVSMVRSGGIVDGKTAVGLLLASLVYSGK